MSKSRCSLPKNARLQVILSILELFSKENGLTTIEVMDKVVSKGIEVSYRTILRDLNDLSIYTPISEETRGGTTYWFWAGEVNRKVTYIDEKWRKLFIEFNESENTSEKLEELA